MRYIYRMAHSNGGSSPGHFRLRGKEMSRIDAFSDVIFGFAITLLVVSLEVPKTFEELHAAFAGFLPFGICFLLLMTIWYRHYQFFRRYGLHDTTTIILNACLLFVVLFYVYPLKFMFTAFTATLMGKEMQDGISTAAQVREIMVLCGLGFTATYSLLAAMVLNAWRQRDTLGLDAAERLQTRAVIIDNAGYVAIGIVSITVALLARSRPDMAGPVYLLIMPWATLHGMYFGRKIRLLRQAEAAAELQVVESAPA